MYVLAVCVCVYEEEFVYIEMDVYRWVSYVLCECVCPLKCTSTVCIGCVGICLHLDFSIKFLTSHCNQCD